MNETTFQSERPLLRMGSIAFLVGVIIVLVSTMVHPSREDPANHPLVFREYANSDSWIAIHIGQLAGGLLILAGGFIALFRLLVITSASGLVSALAWLGLAATILTASTLVILQAVDGIALKRAVDSWVNAPQTEKTVAFRVAEGIRWLEIGVNSIFRFLQGTVAAIFGVAIAKSRLLSISRWIGGAGILLGAISIIAGIEVAYAGFGYTNFGGLRGISMIFYSIWLVILGAFMWKKTISKKAVTPA